MNNQVVYFVTLVIRMKTMKGEKQTIFQKIQKLGENPEEAIENTKIEAQMQFHNMKVLATSVTMLTPKIFE